MNQSIASLQRFSFPLHRPAVSPVNARVLSSQPPLLLPSASPSWSVCATPWCWPGSSRASSAARISPATSWITARLSTACRRSGTRPTPGPSARGPTGWVGRGQEARRGGWWWGRVSGRRELHLRVPFGPAGVRPEGEQEVPVPGAGGQHGGRRHPVAAQ